MPADDGCEFTVVFRDNCISYSPAIPTFLNKEVLQMQVTDVRVRKIAKEGRMKAVVSITLDDEFVVHDIKVIEGDKGLFIAMPSKRTADGEYKDIAHPINSSARDAIQKVILESYEKALLEPDGE